MLIDKYCSIEYIIFMNILQFLNVYLHYSKYYFNDNMIYLANNLNILRER